ncbi:MAG: acetolactate synthase large subunit, partial [Nitrospirae bacterium]|nr:acetolactate synthase large subunit [Nitrospirota bacterium]
RATGNIKKFCPRTKIVHIDIDQAEIDKIKKSHLSISGDIGLALRQLIPRVHSDKRKEWISQVEKMRAGYPFVMPKSKDPLHPINLIRNINGLVAPDTIITTDVGQHQMWVAQSYPFKYPRTLLTSGGLGTMGFGLPAAIGAALTNPDKRTVCISGDGSFLMNIQELATLADLNLKVTVIIMNNGHLGLVRQQQELFYGGKYIASRFKTNPDFAGVARDFGIQSYDLAETNQPMKILAKALSEPGPCVVNVPINCAENVLPIVPPGAANNEMIGGDEDA